MDRIKSKGLAEILGISQRRINQLAKEGVLVKDSRGFFVLVEAVPAYIAYATTENDELRQEKILHERAKRRKAELELKVREGKLHEAEDVEFALTGMLVTFRNRLLSIPSKLAPQLIGVNSIAEIQTVIDTELREAMTELSEYDPAMFNGEVAQVEDEDETLEGSGA